MVAHEQVEDRPWQVVQKNKKNYKRKKAEDRRMEKGSTSRNDRLQARVNGINFQGSSRGSLFNIIEDNV